MRRSLMLAIAALSFAALIASACSDEDDATPTAEGAATTAATATEAAASPTAPANPEHEDGAVSANAAVEAAGMLAALNLIDGAEFHAVDEALNGDAPAIDAAWLGATRRAHIAAQAIAWPHDLQEHAQAFIAAAADLEAALGADDPAAAAAPAAATHATQHDLSALAYDYLAGRAGLETAAGHGHEGDAELVEAPADLVVAVEAEPADGGGVRIRVLAEPFTFVGDGRDEHVPGEGHAHVFIDGEDRGMFFEPEFTVADVASGAHEVMVVLATNTHADYARGGEPLSATTNVELP